MRPRWRRRWARWATTAFFVALLVLPIDACGPGRGIGGRRAARRKLMPLVFKQHVPNISENTLGASGLPEGRIHRGDKRFNELVPNRNLDIVFKNEEGTGADWLMTKRCKEKLNTLAISVMNQWPGVKLRVTEAWDDEGVHATDSLHYEGRAVDITTSDRDRSKYGLLARLAVQAGFDWVYYESRSHIHCSVKSESSQAAKSGGCFDGNSSVRTRYGSKLMSQVEAGDELLTMDSDGRLVYSQVMMFLDRDPDARRVFYVIHTQSGNNVTVTPNHLVYVSESANENQSEKITFARNIAVGDKVYVVEDNQVTLETVVDISMKVHTGVYAPLTRQGTIIVDNVIASCYAVIDSATIAHWAFLPVRIYYSLSDFVTSLTKTVQINTAHARVAPSGGVHWYARLLYSVARWILPKHLTYDE